MAGKVPLTMDTMNLSDIICDLYCLCHTLTLPFNLLSSCTDIMGYTPLMNKLLSYRRTLIFVESVALIFLQVYNLICSDGGEYCGESSSLVSNICSTRIDKCDVSTISCNTKFLLEVIKEYFAVLLVALSIDVVQAHNG